MAILALYRTDGGGHQYIVRILAKIGIYPNIFIDMELCDLNLEDFIHAKKGTMPICFAKYVAVPFRWQQICHVMWHISKGIEFLHSKGMVHGDLKPVNGISQCCL